MAALGLVEGHGVRVRVAGAVPARRARVAARPQLAGAGPVRRRRDASAPSSPRCSPGASPSVHLHYPFYASAIGSGLALLLGLLLGRRALWDAMQPHPHPRGREGRRRRRGVTGDGRPPPAVAGRASPMVVRLPRRFSCSAASSRRRRCTARSSRRLRERGVADVVVANVWTPDWLLAAVARPRADPHPVRSGAARGVARGREAASLGAPVLVDRSLGRRHVRPAADLAGAVRGAPPQRAPGGSGRS